MTDAERDIGAALYRLRRAFAMHGIPCPQILEFNDSRSGYDALVALRHALGPVCWAMDPNAKPYGEAHLQGFTFRFEARSIERPGTGVELDDGTTGRIFRDELKRGEE